MKKILIGAASIVLVAAAAVGATGAFFSDSETSSGNVFTAGAIDLTVDSTQHYNNAVCVIGPEISSWQLAPGAVEAGDQYPVIGSPCDGTWAETNLGPTFHFFNFGDVKPADQGEDTISLHIENNSAWVCAYIKTTGDNENGINNPESKSGDVTNDPSGGELAENIHVFAWLDNGVGGVDDSRQAGDNIWQADEPILQAPLSLSALNATTTLTLADSTTGNGPLAGGTTSFIGLGWCAGTLVVNGPGSWSCDGSTMGNDTQTDSATTSVSFYVEQSRNNANFRCSNATLVHVTANDLDPNGPNPATVRLDGLDKWFMYNDTNDTVDNTLGTFVAGPGTPPFGANSIQFVLAASPLDRKNIATYQFAGTPLSSITEMKYGAYSHSGVAGPNESPYLNFNIDFTGSSVVFQKRIAYVPSQNGGVPQDTWNSFDTIQSGNAKWVYSGATWPAPNAIPGTSPKTWTQILADYPSARILPSDSWLGIRVGEPGPTGYIGNVDFFTIATSSGPTTYDFGN